MWAAGWEFSRPAQKPLLSRVKPRPGTKGPFVPGRGFTRDKSPPHIFPSSFALLLTLGFSSAPVLLPPPREPSTAAIDVAPPPSPDPTTPPAPLPPPTPFRPFPPAPPSSRRLVSPLRPSCSPHRASRAPPPSTSRRRPEPAP